MNESEFAMKYIIKCLGFVAIGFLMMAGIRAAEWVIAKPPVTVVVCFVGDDGDLSECKNLSSL